MLFWAKMFAPVRGIERERENLSKVVVLLAKINAPVRGMERESKSFKSGGFFGNN